MPSVTPKILPAAASATNPALMIGDLLEAGVRMAGDNQIVYRDQSRHSYERFRERVHQLAHTLTSQGVQAGDVVAVLDWDSHRYLECFFAIPMIGAVLHTVNVRLAPEQILYTMDHAEDVFVIVHEEFVPLLEPLADKLPQVRGYLLCQETPQTVDTTLPLVGEFESLLSQQPTHYDFPTFDENAVATLFYTTGTTGNPKGVFFTHRQLVLHTLNESSAFQAPGFELLNRDKVYMPITPMFHVHAWGVPYTATLMGATQVYPGRYEPEMLVKLLVSEKVDFSHCVPTLLNMVVSAEAITSKQVDLAGWKVLVGGSALTESLASKAWALGIDTRSAYGMSETCPLLTADILPQDIGDADFETQLPWRCKAGLPIPLVKLQVVDADGEPLPNDGKSVGEVRVQAPWLTQAYYKEEKRSEELWRNGWLHTGDVGSLDERGFLTISDRIKDVIKTGGEWLSSLELESYISQCPGIAEVAVIGVTDDKWGERPAALAVPADLNNPPTTEAVQAFLEQFVAQGKLNRWGIPSMIRFVDEIPKTSVGKLDKKRIRTEI
ncbi:MULTISPECIES: fatty acid--CoA ligase [Halomonadaceae]|jgi:fatty-acyl-CoA synthase|uniref:Long-chain-fatty-acid--CoA ligase n=2 Tax=Halomonadaceae TaxID=28256 RepID=A0A653U5V8_9GAMM|nr:MULTISPECIES: fatty acid--CoA ligase [Halomonas]MCD1586590.1 fatty acid--CoA ligase [Halomonas sp. IOP_14]QKS24074.1 Long-chain-fatty-acid--CoA ligase [Halomonas titanicae]QNU60931.1 fatty acid--CoA ligase [Halomonas titanicae]CAD5246013.1 Medium-chain-fatty-acid--CoA ligase [Halomonas sp. 113]CAD5253555.1 Medium-chain-fatty-acid--CoA ligase [Halomonas sp. 156]